MSDVWIVYVTAPPDHASTLARALVERRLCACCNLIPIASVYRWEGEVQEEPESLLVIKTTEARFPELREAILTLHPYALPEIIATELRDAHLPYLEWVRGEVG